MIEDTKYGSRYKPLGVTMNCENEKVKELVQSSLNKYNPYDLIMPGTGSDLLVYWDEGWWIAKVGEKTNDCLGCYLIHILSLAKDLRQDEINAFTYFPVRNTGLE